MREYCSELVFPAGTLPLRVDRATQAAAMPPHCHDYTEIVMVSAGSSTHRLYEQADGDFFAYGLMPGDVFAIQPGEIHEYTASSGFVIYNIALIPAQVLPSDGVFSLPAPWEMLLGNSPISRRRKLHLRLQERSEVERYLGDAARELKLRKPGYQIGAVGALICALATAARGTISQWMPGRAVDDGIIRAIGAMEDAPEKHFTLPSLARLAAMSVPNFTEKFRRHTGCSPIAYLTRLRLEKAGHLLETYDLPLSTIAANCGFCDSNYLIKLFRRSYGMTPSRYRRSIGAASEPRRD